MMKSWFVMGLLCVSLVGVARADDTLHFAKEGFSVKALHPTIGMNTVQVLMLQLPSDGTFAPNVNIQIQPFPGSMDDYVKTSLDEFKQLGLTLSSKKKTGEDAVTLEYSGTMRGLPLQFYARAVKKKSTGVVYLITGTTHSGQWAKSGPEIKACVDSFKLE